MKKFFLLLPFLAAIIMLIVSCKKTEKTSPAPLVPDPSWCTLSANSSTSASSPVTVTVTANPNVGNRTAKLTFAMDSKTVVYLNVYQAGRTTLYPRYGDSIAPDASGMSSTAVQLAAKFKLGWNIGNTMEAS